jgi:hypothetical protein
VPGDESPWEDFAQGAAGSARDIELAIGDAEETRPMPRVGGSRDMGPVGGRPTGGVPINGHAGAPIGRGDPENGGDGVRTNPLGGSRALQRHIPNAVHDGAHAAGNGVRNGLPNGFRNGRRHDHGNGDNAVAGISRDDGPDGQHQRRSDGVSGKDAMPVDRGRDRPPAGEAPEERGPNGTMYLEQTEDSFGDTQFVVPPVIGD